MSANDSDYDNVHGIATSLADLREAGRLIDRVTFDLADKVPSQMVAELVAIAAEIEKITQRVHRYDLKRH